jgi:hypothetical protein
VPPVDAVEPPAAPESMDLRRHATLEHRQAIEEAMRSLRDEAETLRRELQSMRARLDALPRDGGR